MERGTIVTLSGLTTRDDLNGKHAVVLGPARDEDRVAICVLGVEEAINVLPARCTPEEAEVDVITTIQSWNDVGITLAKQKMYTKSIEAFHDALNVATTCNVLPEQVGGVRSEGCRVLCNMAWLCLNMNQSGVEWKDAEKTTSSLLEWCMRTLFEDVLKDSEIVTGGRAVFGAGHVPSQGKENVLILCMKYESSERIFFYDDARTVVREEVLSDGEEKDA